MNSASVSSERSPSLLDVRDLRVWFNSPRGRVQAVRGVSLTLESGKTLGIVGESGSGKSVLSRTIMGLTPPPHLRTIEGEVLFKGRDLLALSSRELRSYMAAEIAMIFQDPMTSLHPVFKVGEQIADVLRLHLGLSRKEARERAIDLLRSVHIAEPERRAREYPHQLSGGMRQRAMIAIALACSPSLLLADEPTTALDVTVQAQILDLLEEKQREHHMGMILVSHDLGVVASHADEIAVMYAGRVVEIAPTAALFSEPRMPYTRALMRSIPRLDDERGKRLSVIAGRPPDPRSLGQGCSFAPRCPRAQPRCAVETPPLLSDSDPNHRFACWYPEQGPIDSFSPSSKEVADVQHRV